MVSLPSSSGGCYWVRMRLLAVFIPLRSVSFLVRLRVTGPWWIFGLLRIIVLSRFLFLNFEGMSFKICFHVCGRRCESSLWFMDSGLTSISIASLITLEWRFCIFASVFVFSKSILCPVCKWCCVNDDDVLFFIEFLCSWTLLLILLFVCPTFVWSQSLHGISYTPWLSNGKWSLCLSVMFLIFAVVVKSDEY